VPAPPREETTVRSDESLVPTVRSIERAIHLVRGSKVMLDQDLALVYGTSTKRVNEQVRRNLGRFPRDFMFQLTLREWDDLRSQIATSSSLHGGRRYPPLAFTEHGAVMLATVLNSRHAVDVSIVVVRTFVRLRELLATHEALSRRLEEIDRKHDHNFAQLFEALTRLKNGVRRGRRKLIGFGR
jgi:hypothetical protein